MRQTSAKEEGVHISIKDAGTGLTHVCLDRQLKQAVYSLQAVVHMPQQDVTRLQVIWQHPCPMQAIGCSSISVEQAVRVGLLKMTLAAHESAPNMQRPLRLLPRQRQLLPWSLQQQLLPFLVLMLIEVPTHEPAKPPNALSGGCKYC